MASKEYLKGNLSKQLYKLFRFNRRKRQAPCQSLTPSPTRSPLHLPSELYFLILTHVATPSFTAIESPLSPNPYSSALILCHVSRAFRRIVLPLLLHTVFLSEAKHMFAFVRALQMQRTYMQQESHLHFDYAACVHRIWIGKAFIRSWDSPRLYRNLNGIDISLLAPALLAADSLAIDYGNLFLLDSCLKYAWNSHIQNTGTLEKSSPLPWNTKTLTLSGNLDSYHPTSRTPEGYAFLASISHIIFFPPRDAPFRVWLSTDARPGAGCEYPLHYKIPERLNHVPWASLTSLQSVSLALPVTLVWVEYSYFWRRDYVEYGGTYLHVELLTVSAPVDTLSSRMISDASAGIQEGHISSFDFRATATCSNITVDREVIHWGHIWASGLR
jgi:hypothetical protein